MHLESRFLLRVMVELVRHVSHVVADISTHRYGDRLTGNVPNAETDADGTGEQSQQQQKPRAHVVGSHVSHNGAAMKLECNAGLMLLTFFPLITLCVFNTAMSK